MHLCTQIYTQEAVTNLLKQTKKKNLKKDFRRGKVIDNIRQNNRQISNQNIDEKEAENLLEETGE